MKHGWSPATPTVFIDGERDRITARSGKIKYQINFENLQKGLMPFVSAYGDLYFGKFSREFFKTRFEYVRSVFLQNLIKAPRLTDWSDFALFSSAFYMYMCRICQQENWQWPALCYRVGNEIEQSSGLSRMLATGMCRPDPWQHLNVLLLQNKNQSPDNVLVDYELITTDQQLHDVLGTEFSQEFFQIPDVNLGLTVDDNNVLKLIYINDGEFHQTVSEQTQTLWQNLVHWHERYGSRPRLQIYTDWPQLVHNSENFWDIEIAGPSKHIRQNIFLPGHIERAVRGLHETQPPPQVHVMHIVNPVPVDVTELLCWLDLEHTTFIDKNHNFVVYRPDQTYRNTFVSLSHLH